MYKYNLGKNSQYKTIVDAKWSGRPAMFGVAIDKLVQIFDLRQGKTPIVVIPNDCPVTKIAWHDTE